MTVVVPWSIRTTYRSTSPVGLPVSRKPTVMSSLAARFGFTKSGSRRKISPRTTGRKPERITFLRWLPLTRPSAVATSTGSSARGSTATEPLAGDPEDPADPEREVGVALDVERAGEVLQAGVVLAADQPDEAEQAGVQDDVGGQALVGVRDERHLAVGEGQGVPFQDRAPALEVRSNRTTPSQPRDPVGDRELVQPGEDPLDRGRPDLVAGDQVEQVGVGRLGDGPDQFLGVDVGEEPGRLVRVGGAQDGKVGGHGPTLLVPLGYRYQSE